MIISQGDFTCVEMIINGEKTTVRPVHDDELKILRSKRKEISSERVDGRIISVYSDFKGA